MRRAFPWLVGSLLALASAEAGLRVYCLFLRPANVAQRKVFRRDGAAGWALAPGLDLSFSWPHKELEFSVVTNDLGLLGREPVAPKAQGEFRVLVLGDSMTFGLGVRPEQTYTALLERSLASRSARPVRVVNAGIPGYSTVQELAWLKAYGPGLQPDLVVLAYAFNDMADNASRLVFADGFIQRDPVLVLGRSSFLLEFLTKGLAPALGLGEETDPTATRPELTLALIGEARAFCRDRGWGFVLLDIPGRETTRFRLPEEKAWPRRSLGPGGGEAVEAFPAFQASGKSPYLPIDAHLSPAGHALVAELLRRRLAGEAARGGPRTSAREAAPRRGPSRGGARGGRPRGLAGSREA